MVFHCGLKMYRKCLIDPCELCVCSLYKSAVWKLVNWDFACGLFFSFWISYDKNGTLSKNLQTLCNGLINCQLLVYGQNRIFCGEENDQDALAFHLWHLQKKPLMSSCKNAKANITLKFGNWWHLCSGFDGLHFILVNHSNNHHLKFRINVRWRILSFFFRFVNECSNYRGIF